MSIAAVSGEGEEKDMPFAKNQDIKIYYEVEGQGPPLVLAYGLTGDVTLWIDTGYIDRLKDTFTVIAFDARGHGKSDKPYETAAYDYRRMVGDVIAVMDAVDLPKVHYWGYSMGGCLGFGIAKHFPDRLLSLVLGGATPLGSPDSTEPSPGEKLSKRAVQEGAGVVVENVRERMGSISPHYERCLHRVDFRAMVAIAQSRSPSLEEDASRIHVPCLFYAGDADEDAHPYGKEAAQRLPNARFLSLPGLNHADPIDAAELIVPKVLSFLANLHH